MTVRREVVSVDRFGLPAMAEAEPVTSTRRPDYSQSGHAVRLDIYAQSCGGRGQTTVGTAAAWFRIRDEEGWIRLAQGAVRPPSIHLPLLTLAGHELWRDGDDDGCGHLFVVLSQFRRATKRSSTPGSARSMALYCAEPKRGDWRHWFESRKEDSAGLLFITSLVLTYLTGLNARRRPLLRGRPP